MLQLKRVSDGNAKCTLAYGISSNTDERPFSFTLMDGGNFEMSRGEFVKAFMLLLSDEFDGLLDLINRREFAHDEMGTYYALVSVAVEEGNKCDSDYVYNLAHAAKRYGRFKTMAETTKEKIILSFGWGTWIDACRLYESMYQIPRDYID